MPRTARENLRSLPKHRRRSRRPRGADAIGIVFDPNSKRCVSVDEAIKIVAAAPPFVTPVGLFVNTTPDEIRRILRLVPLAAVQLQGDERPELVAELKPIRVIKALHLAAGDTAMLDRLAHCD